MSENQNANVWRQQPFVCWCPVDTLASRKLQTFSCAPLKPSVLGLLACSNREKSWRHSFYDPQSNNTMALKKNKNKNLLCQTLSFLSNFTNFLERLAGRHKTKTPHPFPPLLLRLALAAPVYQCALVHRPTFEV